MVLKLHQEVLKTSSKSLNIVLLIYPAPFKANELVYLISGLDLEWKQWSVTAKT